MSDRDERRRMVLDLAKQGITHRRIAEITGIALGTVNNWRSVSLPRNGYARQLRGQNVAPAPYARGYRWVAAW